MPESHYSDHLLESLRMEILRLEHEARLHRDEIERQKIVIDKLRSWIAGVNKRPDPFE